MKIYYENTAMIHMHWTMEYLVYDVKTKRIAEQNRQINNNSM